jgi:ABC-type phosphate transport system substrate-binding protein
MRADRRRRVRAAAVLAIAAAVALLSFGPVTSARATTYVPINGAGSTYADPALNQWAIDLEPQGLVINYNPNGSAQGRQQYIDGQKDYAGSDIAFITNSDPDPFGGVDASQIQFAYSYVPDVAGGLAFMYNLQVDGHKITNMRLSGQTLAEIFTGHITNWDNPAITHDYGEQLPSIPITVVTRSDGAGESYFLTNWLDKEYPSLWIPFCEQHGGPPGCGTGPTEFFPGQSAGFRALSGSDTLSAYIAASSNNGAIGYAEDAYALEYNIPAVNVLNAAGYYVPPTASNVAIALEDAVINPDQNSVDYLMQNLDGVYTDTDPRAYPLSSYSYLIVPRTSRTIDGHTYGPIGGFSDAKGVTLSTYINNILCGDQQTASALGYSPLPEPMVVGGFLQDGDIPGAVKSPAASNYNGCDNPAYHDGVDLVTQDAPYPTPCQKDTAPLYCTVVDGKATSTSPGANGGGSNSPGANGGTSSPGAGKGSGSGGINPNTGQPYGSSTTGTDANADAQDVGLASQPAEQWLYGVLTALELIAAVAVPALLGYWLQRRRRGGRSGPGGPLATGGES